MMEHMREVMMKHGMEQGDIPGKSPGNLPLC